MSALSALVPGGAPAHPVPFGDPHQPAPEPGHFTRPLSPFETQCRAQRVQLAGGALNTVLTDTNATRPFEQLFRRLPEQGIHDPGISPSRPFTVELGSFQVPDQQALLLFDLRPDIYRFSGIDPNDAVPFEARRFGSQMGYDVTIDGNHPGNTKYELEPVPRQPGLAFSQSLDTDALDNPGRPANNSAYVQARANRFGAASGAGQSLMPQRHFRFGPWSLPLTLLVSEKEVIAFEVVIFKPVQSPIAFFEMDMAGILAPLNMTRQLLNCIGMKGEGSQ
jgi:hypothetical protein